MPDFDFQPYRDFILLNCDKQQALYTPTDALLPLQVGTLSWQDSKLDQTDLSPKPTVEMLPVLDGLRKYALAGEREHVILSGRPGSGKSTALQQLRLALAAEGLVPVLVQLKGDRSIPEMIQGEFRRAKQRVTLEQIDDWLLAGSEASLQENQLVLLLDGVNEMPTDDLRRGLVTFREQNSTVPMIFTTRDLAMGGDLGIIWQLEMKPLTEWQIQKFVDQRLPEEGEQMLEHLSDRLKEIAETPLLLKMLCDVFSETGKIPESKGELFRLFDQEYDKFKGYPPVSEDSRRFKSDTLQHLAFLMMTGDSSKPTEFWLTINKGMAEREIESFLIDRVTNPAVKAKEWIEDLLEHHLLQVAADTTQIEFHHQLFQEYYAAEKLLRMFQENHLDITDEQRLQHFYLNYLKWTEVIRIVLSLMMNENKSLKIIQNSLSIDWVLGAQLAGSIRGDQKKTVKILEEIQTPLWLKVELLKKTRSDASINILIKSISSSNIDLSKQVLQVLGSIGSTCAISNLVDQVKHKDSIIKREAINVLCRVKTKGSITVLMEIFNKLSYEEIKIVAIALAESDSKKAMLCLSSYVYKNLDKNIRKVITEAFKEFTDPKVIIHLLQLLQDPESIVITSAAFSLSKVCSRLDISTEIIEEVVESLIKLFVYKDRDITWAAANSLGYIGKIHTSTVIPKLLQEIEINQDFEYLSNLVFSIANIGIDQHGALDSLIKLLRSLSGKINDDNTRIFIHLSLAVGSIGSDSEIKDLMNLVNHKYPRLVGNIAHALGLIASEKAAISLLTLVEDKNLNIISLRTIIEALGKTRSNQATQGLVKIVNDFSKVESHYSSGFVPDSGRLYCISAIINLAKINNPESIKALCGFLNCQNTDIRSSVIYVLGHRRIKEALPDLIKLLKSEKRKHVRIDIVNALGYMGKEESVEHLIDCLDSNNQVMHLATINALGYIGSEQAVDTLVPFLYSDNQNICLATINALGTICSEKAIGDLVSLIISLKTNDTSESLNTKYRDIIPFSSLSHLNKKFKWNQNGSNKNRFALDGDNSLTMSTHGDTDQSDGGIDTSPSLTFSLEEDSFEVEVKINFSSNISFQRAGFGIRSSLDKRSYLRIQKLELNRVEVSRQEVIVAEDICGRVISTHSYPEKEVVFKIIKNNNLVEIFHSSDGCTFLKSCESQEVNFASTEIFINVLSAHNQEAARAIFKCFKFRGVVDKSYVGRRAIVALSKIAKKHPELVGSHLPSLSSVLRSNPSVEVFEAIQSVQASCNFYNNDFLHSQQKCYSTDQTINIQQINIEGDVVLGDKIQGDKVAGDKTEIKTVGNLNTGTVNIAGSQTGETK